MRQAMPVSPLNPLPAVLWALTLPAMAGEIVFLLGATGLVGGADGIGLRLSALQMAAFAPEMVQRMWQLGAVDWDQAYRILSYSFVNSSFTHALFVVVFTLALGNMIVREFRPWAVVALFLGSAIGGALIYTAAVSALPGGPGPLIGGYPAVYGLVGAFTFLLWSRLGAVHANRLRAFSLIGMLLGFQLVFGSVFGGAGHGWIAEIGGFATGFLLSFVLVDGGVQRVLRQIRAR